VPAGFMYRMQHLRYLIYAALVFVAIHLHADEVVLKLQGAEINTVDRRITSTSSDIAAVLTANPPEEMRLLFPDLQDKLPETLRNIYLLRYNGSGKVAALQGLKDSPDVKYATSLVTYRSFQYPAGKTNESYHFSSLNIEAAWQQTRGNSDIVVGIIDTGIDYRHEDLQGAFWINVAEDLNGNGMLDPADENGVDDDGNGYIDDVIGWDFTDAPSFPDQGDYLEPDNDPNDEFQSGHGTPAAGLIASQDNGIGTTGIAPGVKVMALRAGTASGFLQEDDVAEAILYAMHNGCRIVNLSFGDVAFSYLLRDVIRYARENGVLFVAAAGNSGNTVPNYPASYPETISVGATNNADALAPFSSYGNTINLVAPGVELTTTQRDNKYGEVNGTSFAAPLVCGVLSLLLSNDPTLTPEQATGALYAGSRDLGLAGWDNRYGHGIPDAFAVLEAGNGGFAAIVQPEDGAGISTNELAIIGTALSPAISSYTLSYGRSETPLVWEEIATISSRQVLSDTLALWNVLTLEDGTYTLELRIRQTSGADVVLRQFVEIDRTPPALEQFDITRVYVGPESGLLLRMRTDDVTSLRAFFYDDFGLEITNIRTSYLEKEHSLLLTESVLPERSRIAFALENTAGLVSNIGDNESGTELLLPRTLPKSIPLGAPVQLPLQGYLMPEAADVDNDGRSEVWISEISDESFGKVVALEHDGSEFRKVFESENTGIPRDVGKLLPGQGTDIAVGLGRQSSILGGGSNSSFPVGKVWENNNNFWISRFIDADDDGENEVLAIEQGVWKIFEVDTNYNLNESTELSEQGDGNNIYGVPVALYDDFNGNGEPEIVVADVDGDLLVYERSGNSYALTWSTRLNGIGGESLLTAADVDGDGRKEIVTAVRNQPPVLLESNVDNKFWVLTVWEAADLSSYQLLTEINVHGVTVQSGIHNGLSAADVDSDGKDEIVFMPFPDGYLFHFENNELQLLWYQNEVNSNTSVWADLTGNGRSELLLNTTSGLRFWPQEDSGNRPATPSQFKVVALNEFEISLNWKTVPGAEQYRIYRRMGGQNVRVDSSQSDRMRITGLSTDTLYSFAVSAVDMDLPEPESVLSRLMSAQPNPAPVVLEVSAENALQAVVKFSETMSTRTFDASRWALRGEAPASVARIENGRQALLSFDDSFPEGENPLLLIQHEDRSGTPGPDSLIVNFMFMQPNPSLYLTSLELLEKSRLRIRFSQPIDSVDAIQIRNYRIDPDIRILRAEVGEDEVLLILETPNRLGAFGEPHVLTASGIRGKNGSTLNENGSSLEIYREITNLSEVLVYPNPWTAKSQPLRFANLPRDAEVFIFTANGALVRSMKNENAFGALSWDGRNESGRLVASGVYIFIIRLDGAEKKGKLMIVN